MNAACIAPNHDTWEAGRSRTSTNSVKYTGNAIRGEVARYTEPQEANSNRKRNVRPEPA